MEKVPGYNANYVFFTVLSWLRKDRKAFRCVSNLDKRFLFFILPLKSVILSMESENMFEVLHPIVSTQMSSMFTQCPNVRH